MTISRFVRIQLAIFSLVAVVSLVVVGVFYIQVPSMLGIGRYTVHLDLPSTGGIYPNANVTYRGVTVGRVDAVRLTSTGVQADLSIQSDRKIPASSAASVQSVSAVGEQFVQFTPGEDAGGATLRDGSVIRNGAVPTEISDLVDRTDALLKSVQSTKLRRVLDETFDAFDGNAEQLQRLLDSLTLFAGEANRNSAVTRTLIEQAEPLLATQTATVGDIRQWTANVAAVTDQLRANDPELRGILAKGPGTVSQARDLFASFNQTLPLLIDNIATAGKTLAVYLPNLQQVLVLYPRVLQALVSAVNNEDPRKGANVDFALGFQDPGTCTVGFLPASARRSPAVQTPQEIPPGLLCRVPQDSNVAVRGTRNFPCVEFPGRRASTPEECRTGYKPLAENVPFPQGIPGISGLPDGKLTPATPSSYDGKPSVYAGAYDPGSGTAIGPDGKTYAVAAGDPTTAGQGGARGGSTTWQGLITGTVAG
ncbi:MCE family protein [Williamsia deligens]|uniref:MCE family protein n=1 Tax=Williamsia deligens TaxID=321325 RepID=A0ABW3G2V7_9NOCA|nr:MCE family protein [Williamsia deligens]MCP2194380.1 phospholipid/cholesterol/gamma-HCH transport system substrate-binding protein [Williamsia deligens]